MVVLDQFEQLRPEHPDHAPVFELLHRVAREQAPPHRCTWLVAFREEYAATWWKFQRKHGLQPPMLPMLPIERFSPSQAGSVVATLAEAAGFEVDQALADALVRDAINDGKVSPVDIGIGLMMLDELARSKATEHLSAKDYLGASGGADGLLADYVAGRLRLFPQPRREPLLKAMLALADLDTGQRLAEGLSAADLADSLGEPSGALTPDLDYLAGPNYRLLERNTGSDGHGARYRLPHERLVPVLRRFSGAIMARAEQARMALDSAFRAWRSNDEHAKYLLGGADLRAVLRHRRDFHWGEEPDAKRAFVRRSRLRRRRRGIGYAAALIAAVALSGTGWQWSRWVEHTEDLARWQVPRDLHRHHAQLETLVVDSNYVTHLQWLAPNALHWLQGWLPAPLAARLGPPRRQLRALALSTPSLAELRHLPATLIRLELSQNTLLDTLDGLPANMPALASLSLEMNDLLTDVSMLRTAAGQLEYLKLRLNPSLRCPLGLSKRLPKVKHFDVDRCISDIDALPVMPALETLNLSRTAIESLEGLAEKCPKLRELDIRATKVKSLKGLPASVTVLYVGDQISEVPETP